MPDLYFYRSQEEVEKEQSGETEGKYAAEYQAAEPVPAFSQDQTGDWASLSTGASTLSSLLCVSLTGVPLSHIALFLGFFPVRMHSGLPLHEVIEFAHFYDFSPVRLLSS